jgi:two-component system KDP operon response regulator KdpE
MKRTPKEFELLVFLAQQPGRIRTRRAILSAIWGPHHILTEPWVGYRFAEE